MTEATASPRPPDEGPPRRARQRSSHSGLIQDLSDAGLSRLGRVRPLEAIVVPASRKAERLLPLAELAARADVRLVVLASHECDVREASDLIASTRGCRAFIVWIGDDYENDMLRFLTADQDFKAAKAGRDSNLSIKRNLGLMLARLLGWEKIMFVDDDISDVTPTDLAKVALHLEKHQVTGLVARSFPDNSVVGHANRLSGRPQDIFVTGAALGVNCGERPLDFFPDIYNEDWFFLAEHASQQRVISVGTARQQLYKPFADPQRAVREEFGDLIAEGLYSLFGDGGSLNQASEAYWSAFRVSRYEFLERIRVTVYDMPTHEAMQAHESIQRAMKQLNSISAKECSDFVAAWRSDRGAFARTTSKLPQLANYKAACEYLGLTIWQEAEFGVPRSQRSLLTGVPQSLGRRAATLRKLNSAFTSQ